MLVTITQFRSTLKDLDRVDLPIATDYVAGQSMTAVGTSTAFAADTVFVRVATDTAITGNFYGSGSSAYLPANAIEYFPAAEGQTFTIAAA